MSQANPTPEEASAYAAEFIRSGIESDAFRAAFPDTKATKESINTKASKMHKTVQVQSRIGQLTVISQEQTEKEFCVSVSDIKERLLKIADMGVNDKDDQFGNKIPVNLGAATSALSELNKMDGNHAATKHLHGGDADAPQINLSKTEYKEVRDKMIGNDDC